MKKGIKRKSSTKEEVQKEKVETIPETVYCADPVVNQTVKELLATELDNPDHVFERFPKWDNYRLFPCGHHFASETYDQARLYICPHCRGHASGMLTVNSMQKFEAWAIIRRLFPEEECTLCFLKATPFFLKYDHANEHQKCNLCPAINGPKHRCPKRMVAMYCQEDKIPESEIGAHVNKCFECLRSIVQGSFYDNGL